MAERTIRIHYPLASGRICLRVETDWDQDVEAVDVDAAREVHTFRVDVDAPFFYYKAVMRDASGVHWTPGNNSLAGGADPRGIDLYPAFFSGISGTVIGPFQVAGGPLGSHPIRIYLPPGYSENTLKRYPVLYMHDGANLFFPDEAFLGQEWQIDETLDLLDSFALIDKVIVVGVYAGDRMTEYTQPGYETYGRFLAEVLKPRVDAELRTLPAPDRTAVMGSSLGGVVSFYLAWQWPKVFGMAACMSSTFTWRDDLMTRVAAEPKRPVRLYLDSGWPGDNFEATRAMKDLLRARGYVPGQELLALTWPLARHNEADWALRCHVPFQFFFGRWSG